MPLVATLNNSQLGEDKPAYGCICDNVSVQCIMHGDSGLQIHEKDIMQFRKD